MDEEELDDMLLKNQGWVDPPGGEQVEHAETNLADAIFNRMEQIEKEDKMKQEQQQQQLGAAVGLPSTSQPGVDDEIMTSDLKGDSE